MITNATDGVSPCFRLARAMCSDYRQRAMKNLLAALGLLLLGGTALLLAAAMGWFGSHEGPGIISDADVPDSVIAARREMQADTSRRLGIARGAQILFGDLHVHTTLSVDAFAAGLPLLSGDGAHTLADACDFARFCSAVDFWAVTDHAESSTPRRWRQSIESVRQCNAVGETGSEPDTIAYLGFEWTRRNRNTEDHFGGRTVITRDIEEAHVPLRPIAAALADEDSTLGISRLKLAYLALIAPGKRQLDFAQFVHETRSVAACPDGVAADELPTDCRETAATPNEFHRRLAEAGHATLTLSHGTTQGSYPPDSRRSPVKYASDVDLIEIISGYGSAEVWRSWREVEVNNAGESRCPEPVEGYLPTCWRAGEIVAARCSENGGTAGDCAARATAARQDYIDDAIAGKRALAAEEAQDWLDAGQCRDCYLPAFNYRPAGSLQFRLAARDFDAAGNPVRRRIGVTGASDSLRARPGTGYKEFFRLGMTNATGPRDARAARALRAPAGNGTAQSFDDLLRRVEFERQSSFLSTGGLVAAHVNARDRGAVWDALQRREVYATSGSRMLLWFHLDNAPDRAKIAMGSGLTMRDPPSFTVRAAGSFKQRAGCPEHALDALSPERLDDLCRGECYYPADERKLVSRIEVVRIFPQNRADEDIAGLIEDPWQTHVCKPDPHGCTFRFSDEDYPRLKRDAIYYVRAIESPSAAVNAGNLRCEYDDEGACTKVELCSAGYKGDADDDCLTISEEHAWSSPIYVDWKK